MKIFSRGTLRDFWEKHGNCELQLKTWYRETEKSNWLSINDLKSEYPNASILKDNRIVFNNKLPRCKHTRYLVEESFSMKTLGFQTFLFIRSKLRGIIPLEIKGHDYRLIVKFNFEYQLAWIRFIGTHAEYDKINANEI